MGYYTTLARWLEIHPNHIKKGEKLAKEGYIVTFGAKPTKPDSGYGYIETMKDESIAKIFPNALKVSSFKEKPDTKTAKGYISKENY